MTDLAENCGPWFTDHIWNHYYRDGMLVAAECDVCGLTPQQFMEHQAFGAGVATAATFEKGIVDAQRRSDG